jgi:inner membrane protein
MRTELDALVGSVIGKVLFIGLLMLLLLLPLGMIRGLVQERTLHFQRAADGIAQAYGRPQTVGGPILIVPFRSTRTEANGATTTLSDELLLLPEHLEIKGTVESKALARGIYSVPVYATRLHVSGRFRRAALEGQYENLQFLWNQAQIALPLTDARSVQEPIVLASGNGTTAFQASVERAPGFGPQLVASYSALGQGAIGTPQEFSFDVALNGTGGINFLPLGDETRVTLASNWPSPNFAGAYLPEARDVTPQGFSAEWHVLDLGRGYPSQWRRSEVPPVHATSAFGVELITPVGIHEATTRATKYALFIVGMTFAAYFLFEIFAALLLHPLQYLLVGLANCVFYLLLLALAEHVGFAVAYAASAVAAAGLVTSYSAAVLGSFKRALPIGSLLSILYAYLYVTLLAEDFALLIGALGSFAVLAAFMYLTRHVDWFALNGGRLGAARSEEPPPVDA